MLTFICVLWLKAEESKRKGKMDIGRTWTLPGRRSSVRQELGCHRSPRPDSKRHADSDALLAQVCCPQAEGPRAPWGEYYYIQYYNYQLRANEEFYYCGNPGDGKYHPRVSEYRRWVTSKAGNGLFPFQVFLQIRVTTTLHARMKTGYTVILA